MSDQLVVENMYPLDHSRLNFPKEAKLTSGRFVNPIAKVIDLILLSQYSTQQWFEAKAEVITAEENPSVKKEVKDQKQAEPKNGNNFENVFVKYFR